GPARGGARGCGRRGTTSGWGARARRNGTAGRGAVRLRVHRVLVASSRGCGTGGDGGPHARHGARRRGVRLVDVRRVVREGPLAPHAEGRTDLDRVLVGAHVEERPAERLLALGDERL